MEFEEELHLEVADEPPIFGNTQARLGFRRRFPQRERLYRLGIVPTQRPKFPVLSPPLIDQ